MPLTLETAVTAIRRIVLIEPRLQLLGVDLPGIIGGNGLDDDIEIAGHGFHGQEVAAPFAAGDQDAAAGRKLSRVKHQRPELRERAERDLVGAASEQRRCALAGDGEAGLRPFRGGLGADPGFEVEMRLHRRGHRR